ncbi:MAG: DUF3054 domain-containing protein [Acidimicrobiia bacterium]|nr:DUF3054 domain-containing protein [Acidimicrobiia bacterium]
MNRHDDSRVPLAAGLDTASVVLFVAIGKREHDQDTAIVGLVETAAPFMIGLLVAWLVFRVWNRPTAWTTGLLVWPVTLIVGMVLRSVVFGGGTAAAFVLVATGFLGMLFVGWRAALAVYDRRTSSA